MTSSLFEPNTALLAKFQNLEELTRVKKTYRIETKRLDDVAEVRGCDFLKVDRRGGEADKQPLPVASTAVQCQKPTLAGQRIPLPMVHRFDAQPTLRHIDSHGAGP
jgi:hypothetical protein